MRNFLIVLTLCLASTLAQDKDVRCPASEDATKPTQFGHSTDCGKFFKCLNGRSFEISCPDNQHWNKEKNYCDTIVNAKCDLKKEEQVAFQPFQQPNRPNFPHQQQPIQRPNFPQQQPNQRPNFPQQQPVQRPNFPQQQPVQRPNFPQQQPIQRPQPQPIPRPQPQPIPRPQPIPPAQRPNVPQQPIAPPQRPNVPQSPIFEHPDFIRCPSTDRQGQIIYFPYHLNCDMFYQCVGGRAVLLRCPAGMAWDLRTNHCDRAQNVICATPRRPLN